LRFLTEWRVTSTRNFAQFGFDPAPADRPLFLRLSSLDLGSPITNVTFITSLNGQVSWTFGSDFAEFTFFDQPVSAGQTYLTAQFLTDAPVPEPETFALMLAGLGLVGGMVARRRAKASATR
jgi:hypothetical protein